MDKDTFARAVEICLQMVADSYDKLVASAEDPKDLVVIVNILDSSTSIGASNRESALAVFDQLDGDAMTDAGREMVKGMRATITEQRWPMLSVVFIRERTSGGPLLATAWAMGSEKAFPGRGGAA